MIPKFKMGSIIRYSTETPLVITGTEGNNYKFSPHIWFSDIEHIDKYYDLYTNIFEYDVNSKFSEAVNYALLSKKKY